MEQFNPGLRNLVNLGKNYEKSVTGEYLDSRCHFTLKLNVGLALKVERIAERVGAVKSFDKTEHSVMIFQR